MSPWHLLWEVPCLIAAGAGAIYAIMVHAECQRVRAMEEWKRKWH